MLIKINKNYIITPKFKNTTEQTIVFSNELEDSLLSYTNVIESAKFMVCPCTDHEVSHLQYYVNLENIPEPCQNRMGLCIHYFQINEVLSLLNNVSHSDKTIKTILLSKWNDDIKKFMDVDSLQIQKKIKLSQSSIDDFLLKNGWQICDYEYVIDAPVKIKPVT